MIVIPARGLAVGKTRLTATLSPEARAALTERMLTQVIRAALAANVATDVVVVSPDVATLDFATTVDERVHPLRQDAATPGLNPALQQARLWARQRGATELLILFGDLPLLTATDVEALAWADAPVVLAPDRHGHGTNAALVSLISDREHGGFAFQFGAESLTAHLAEAERLGLEVATVIAPGTAFDLDTPEDWRSLLDQDEVEAAVTLSALNGATESS